MSQYGALDKARRGAKAGAILSSYYPGARLAHLPPEQLPATIRVALEPVRPTMVLSGPGRFRLLDGAGRAVAVAASGEWRIGPGPQGRLRVTPPADQHSAPVVEPVALDPASPSPGQAVTMRVRLSAPAVVHLSVQGPAGPVPIGGPQLLEAGEWPLAAGPLPESGRHVVSIVADAGADRVASVPVTVSVEGAVSGGSLTLAGHGSDGSGLSPSAGWSGLVAFVLWAAAAALGPRWARLVRPSG